MVQLKAPSRYIREHNSILQIGTLLSEKATRVLIIGGKTALDLVQQQVEQSLTEENIYFQQKLFTGYCTPKAVQQYEDLLVRDNYDYVLAVGGGAAIDVAKAAANKAKVPISTIPTVAATCACSTALSVLYNEAGQVTGYEVLDRAPEYIVVDPTLLIQAPIKFFRAGIADTFVKWYETAPHQFNEYDVAFELALQIARYTKKTIETFSWDAVNDYKQSTVSEALLKIIDAILFTSGVVGSFQSKNSRVAIAHAIHDQITAYPESHKYLHGEKVIIGILVQLVLEGRKEEEIIRLIHFLRQLQLPITLEELGIEQQQELVVIEHIAKTIKLSEKTKENITFKINEKRLREALVYVTKLGRANSLTV